MAWIHHSPLVITAICLFYFSDDIYSCISHAISHQRQSPMILYAEVETEEFPGIEGEKGYEEIQDRIKREVEPALEADDDSDTFYRFGRRIVPANDTNSTMEVNGTTKVKPIKVLNQEYADAKKAFFAPKNKTTAPGAKGGNGTAAAAAPPAAAPAPAADPPPPAE